MKVRPWTVRPDFRLTAHVVAGRYRLDDLLGRGGGADVYEGLDLRLRRPVAVKVLRPEGEAPTEERFDSEARLLARLQHPGLVTVYDCGRDDGQPFLVMELIKGTTLRRRIAGAPLTPAEACRLGSALASALAHVHANGVVHRDVKPSNILLDETGVPYLTDFGISRLLDSTAHTVTGTLVGTAAYMAPEQVLGRGAGPAADVYSLGLVLLEALKGELEYDGTPLEAAIARLHRAPVFPPSLPEGLTALLRAMTAVDETGRPDAGTCSRALAEVAEVAEVTEVNEVAEVAGVAAGIADARSEAQGGASGPGGSSEALPHRRPEGLRVPEPRAMATAREEVARIPAQDQRTHAGRRRHRSHRTHRALLTAGSTLAALGVALTGSTGAPPSDARDTATRPPRPATTKPAVPAADDRPSRPASPSAAPASPTGARTTAGTGDAAGRSGAVTGGSGVPAAATVSREQPGRQAQEVRQAREVQQTQEIRDPSYDTPSRPAGAKPEKAKGKAKGRN
ncbi:serine/threonine-protein kinase [Streptomyces lavendulocolor]|uniref:non-specific serine/threonine protein kinase n=1 Tax=Streptomyces lavendulocolor TaxID=67316 RepID=A0ABV2W5I9_9ACTN